MAAKEQCWSAKFSFVLNYKLSAYVCVAWRVNNNKIKVVFIISFSQFVSCLQN